MDVALLVAVALVGTALTVAVFMTTRSRERTARRIEFDRQAAQVALAARSGFDVPLAVLDSVPAFFDASTEVTRAEFRTFARHALTRYPWIYALEWIPRVPGAERAAMEAAARADGLTDFHFKQDAPSGPPVRADERAEYFPLYYMEPPNPVPLGLEETALDVRRTALERARDHDTTIVTQRLRLVQDDASIPSVIAFHPVYAPGGAPESVKARRERLRGYTAEVFRVAPVVAHALRGVDFGRLDVCLADVDASPEQLLFESRRGTWGLKPSTEHAVWEQVTTIGGRRWAIRVADRPGWVHAGTTGYVELTVGLIASLLGAALAFAVQSVAHLRNRVRMAHRLGQYTLVEKLGEGGMGTVFRAHHALLRRPTAIKLLHPERRSPAALARFESEVQLTSSLTNPNTVVVYDYGHSPDGVFYYAMEYIDGITLQQLVDLDGPQPSGRVVKILLQVCSALAEAHGVGLVHRDIKPANIMVCHRGGKPDFAKVLDFGLAKDLSGDDARLSQSTALLGTPLYVAPEMVVRRAPIDARADLYAVGAVAYFMLTGTPVFPGTTVVDVCVKHVSAQPDPLGSRVARSFPPQLEALVMRCLAKDPAQRPASAEELADALRQTPVEAWTVEDGRRWWRERGEAIEQQLRQARSDGDSDASGRTLAIDLRRDASPPTVGGDLGRPGFRAPGHVG
jgi:serine/threonine protein kinase/CHASE1-domain containing sensor protein